MPTEPLRERIDNQLAVLVADLDWLNDAFGDEVIDEVAEVLAEMTAAVAKLDELSKEIK